MASYEDFKNQMDQSLISEQSTGTPSVNNKNEPRKAQKRSMSVEGSPSAQKIPKKAERSMRVQEHPECLKVVEGGILCFVCNKIISGHRSHCANHVKSTKHIISLENAPFIPVSENYGIQSSNETISGNSPGSNNNINIFDEMLLEKSIVKTRRTPRVKTTTRDRTRSSLEGDAAKLNRVKENPDCFRIVNNELFCFICNHQISAHRSHCSGHLGTIKHSNALLQHRLSSGAGSSAMRNNNNSSSSGLLDLTDEGGMNFGNLEKIADIESFIQEQEHLNELMATNEDEMHRRVLEQPDCLRIRGNDLYCFICDINVQTSREECEEHLLSLNHASAIHKIEGVFLI